MKEININTQEKTENKVIEEKPKSLVEQVKELKDFKNKVESKEIKVKNIRIPRKLKVKGRKLKKGWIGIMKVDENDNASMEKQKVLGSAYRDSSGTFHATDGREVLYWNGKFPFIIQPTWRNNPLNVKDRVTEVKDKDNNIKYKVNETYGDKYKMAKMLESTIKVKKQGGNIIIWVLIAGAVLFGINYFAGGNLLG